MEHKELVKKINEIDAKAEKEKSALYAQHATENNPFKKGDIIELDSLRILIEQMTWMDRGRPRCLYSGKKMTKLNAPFAKKALSHIEQNERIILIKEGI
jgi:hypothetical protein